MENKNNVIESVYYDRVTGRVLDEEVKKVFETHDPSILKGVKVGFMSRARAQIVDGYIQNMPSVHKEFTLDPFAFVANQNGEKKETDEAFQRSIDESLAFFNSISRQRASSQVPRSYTDAEKREIYQHARRKSNTEKKQSSERNRSNKKPFNKQIIIYTLIVIMSVSATLGVSKLVDETKAAIQTYQTEQSMGDLLVAPNAKRTPNLVSRNTHHTDDFQGYWIDNAGVAEELLELPDEAFDAEFYATYVEYGKDRKNAYIDNFSEMIRHLGQDAKAEENALAFARANGCTNFDEYLIKNGFVNENGEPDVDKFIEYGKQAVSLYQPYLGNIVDERNAAAAQSDDEPTRGGR